MNWLDIVLIVVIVISAFSGLRIGLIKGVLSILGLIVGVILAGRYYIPFSEHLSFIPQEAVAKVLAFVIIVLVILVVAGIIAWLLDRIASAVMLGWLNHLGGAVFSAVLGAITCATILTIWVKLIGTAAVITDSALAPALLSFFSAVLSLLPASFKSASPFF
jgi:membrane protein required for colicin V production